MWWGTGQSSALFCEHEQDQHCRAVIPRAVRLELALDVVMPPFHPASSNAKGFRSPLEHFLCCSNDQRRPQCDTSAEWSLGATSVAFRNMFPPPQWKVDCPLPDFITGGFTHPSFQDYSGSCWWIPSFLLVHCCYHHFWRSIPLVLSSCPGSSLYFSYCSPSDSYFHRSFHHTSDLSSRFPHLNGAPSQGPTVNRCLSGWTNYGLWSIYGTTN